MKKLLYYHTIITTLALVLFSQIVPSIASGDFTTYKIDGYIAPEFLYDESNLKEVRSGFKVEVAGTDLSCLTDENGRFELNIPVNYEVYRLQISKTNYLNRKVDIKSVNEYMTIGKPSTPLMIWAGDILEGTGGDGVINMVDIVRLAMCFNSIKGDSVYKIDMDFNRDNSINLVDIMIVANNFNKSSEDYSLEAPVIGRLDVDDLNNTIQYQKLQLKKFTELMSEEGTDKARETIISDLNEDPKIKQAGWSDRGDTLWYEDEHGVLGGFTIRNQEGTSNNANNGGMSYDNTSLVPELSDPNTSVQNTPEQPASLNSAVPVVTTPTPEPLPTSDQPGPRIANRKVLLLSPMLYEFGINDDNDVNANTPNVFKTLKDYKFNEKEVIRDKDITFLKDKEVTVEFLRNEMYKYGIISISSHGDNLFQNLRSEPSWGGRDNEKRGVCGFFLTQGYEDIESSKDADEIIKDLQMHRLAIFSFFDEETKEYASNLFVLPSFIEAHFKNTYLNNIILMGTCKSTYNSTMGDAFLKQGARAYLGYPDSVPNAITRTTKSSFLKHFLNPFATSGYALNMATIDCGKEYLKMLGANNLKPPVPILDLGTNNRSYASDINSKGQITGWTFNGKDTYPYPFLYTEAVRTLLNTEPSLAYSINDNSQICMNREKEDDSGYIYTNGFLWQSGKVENLGYTTYMDINENGQIIGYSIDKKDYNVKGFLINNGVYKDLGNFLPVDINNKGQIIGLAVLIPEDEIKFRSFLYENGVYKDLGSLNKTARKVSFEQDTMSFYLHDIMSLKADDDFLQDDSVKAASINDKGQIAGYSSVDEASQVKHAFIWENGSMKDLGTLGGKWSFAYDINNDGTIVGRSAGTQSTNHAVMWKNGKIFDLSEMATLGYVEGRMTIGKAINDNGQVVGYDFNGNAVIWTP